MKHIGYKHQRESKQNSDNKVYLNIVCINDGENI